MLNELSFRNALQVEANTLSIASRQLHERIKLAPEGSLNTFTKNGSLTYFYQYLPGEQRVYLPKSDLSKIEQLAQKDYDKKMVQIIDSRLLAANVLLKTYEHSISEQFELLPPVRQELITPLIPTDEEFISKWYAQHPGAQNPYPITNGFVTMRGETVRSKSEKILADLFHLKNIPYIYEPMLQLNNSIIYPDFLVLNVRLRKAYYYEHFGMMDDKDYRPSRFDLIKRYRSNGYWEGENLLYDFEERDYQLDIMKIEEMVNHYLM